MTTNSLFVGVDARTPELLALAEELRVDEGLKVPRSDGLHLTLRFLGRGHDPAVVEAALITMRFAPFTLALEGLGTFGGRSPRVLWAAVKEDASLRSLADEVDARLAPAAGARDRAFAPHATVARARGGGEPLKRWARETRGRALGEVRVDAVNLYESVPVEEGPNRYEVIARFAAS